MILLLLISAIILQSPVKSAGGGGHNRPNWSGGGGGRGGGHVNPLQAPHHATPSQNVNRGNNRGGAGGGLLGFVASRIEKRGCSRPGITDTAATFEIEGCRTNSRQDSTQYCRNEKLEIPAGISGVLSCLRGRRLLRLTSRCEDDGSWKPPLVENCNELFELLDEYKGNRPNPPIPDEDEHQEQIPPRHCPQIKLNQAPNFIITCQSPGQSEGVDCMDQYPSGGIPSGIKLSVQCRPPSVSLSPEPNDLLCQDGRWEGAVKKLICTVPRPQPQSLQLPVTTPAIPQPKPIFVEPSPTPTPTPVVPKNPPVVPKGPPAPTTTCPPLTALSGVELSCLWSGTEVGTNDCRSTRLPVGTEAKYSCGNYYEAKGQLPILYRKCNSDGAWTGSPEFSCTVQCGRENVVKIPYITDSEPTLKGQWPWHAAIFRKSPKDNESWEYICGGTLITPKALITAGHCVTLLQTREVVDKDDLQIHLGKYRREVTDEHVQIKSIGEIILEPNYNPYNFDSDLAIIILKNDATIGHFVRPICFLSTSDSGLEDLQLSENSIGTVVGWGYDETNKLADDLRMAHLRVVGSRECAESMIGSSITQLNARSTTFCAGYSNGTNVCNGDSGSGMYFPTKDTDNTKWYIQGLVSVGIAHSNGRCNPEAYSVFTRLGRYADFVSRTLSEQDAL